MRKVRDTIHWWYLVGLTARLARVSSMRRRSIGPACCSILGYGSLTEGSESGWGWGVGGGGGLKTLAAHC